jgi:hypothetical protein
MKGRGYLPSADELRAEILRQADEYYEGVHAPGVGKFPQYAPRGWSHSRTIARRFGHSMDAAGWAALVMELTGLPTVTQREARALNAESERYAESLDILSQERRRFRHRLPYDPDEYPDGLRCSSVRVVDGKVHFLLR